MRTTLAKALHFEGVGLHTGRPVAMSLNPARPGAGFSFRRTDLAPGTGDIPARYDFVTDTQLCTRLSNAGGASVGTVEHTLAALAGLGITDALIAVDGPELPILDGSAQPFVDAIQTAGIRRSAVPLRAIRLVRPVSVEHDGKRAALLPADRTEIAFDIAFPDPAIGVQSGEIALTPRSFAAQLADCRTFCMLAEVEYLRKRGLARGGSLENAIVVDRGRVLNPEGLRRPDEFVRHKMLDAVGDLALAGAPLVARYEGNKAGHDMTNRLLRALFAEPTAWYWGAPLPMAPAPRVAACRADLVSGDRLAV